MNENPSIFDYIKIIKEWKKFIIMNVVLLTTIATVIAFILPKWYYSNTSLKPSENQGVSFFSAMLGSKGLGGIGKSLNVGGLQYSDLDYYISLLNSRSISLKMIEKFNLQNEYEKEYIFQTIEELVGNSTFEADPTSNLLFMGVYDKNPQIAKEMLEEFLLLLDGKINELRNKELVFNKKFLGTKLYSIENDLKNAENKLKNFQEKNNVVLPVEQFESTILAIAELEGQKLVLETQIAILKVSNNEESPQGINLKTQLNVIQNKINSIGNSTSKEIFLNYDKAPELMNEYLSLYRNVEIQGTLLEYIFPMYEEAKMANDKQAPPFVVIDEPNLPEYKSKPKRAIIILMGVFISIFFSIFYIYIVEFFRKNKNEF